MTISRRTLALIGAAAVVLAVGIIVLIASTSTLDRAGFDAKVKPAGWQPTSESYDAATAMCGNGRDDSYIAFVAKMDNQTATAAELDTYVAAVRATC